MEINNVNLNETTNVNESEMQNEYVPVKLDTTWSKIKAFFLQEVESENFWFKDISVDRPISDNGTEVTGLKGFLFQEITLI